MTSHKYVFFYRNDYLLNIFYIFLIQYRNMYHILYIISQCKTEHFMGMELHYLEYSFCNRLMFFLQER